MKMCTRIRRDQYQPLRNTPHYLHYFAQDLLRCDAYVVAERKKVYPKPTLELTTVCEFGSAIFAKRSEYEYDTP